MLTLILLVFAFVLACIAAWQSPQPAPYGRLIAAALAFYFAACIFGNQIIATHFPK